MNNSIFMDKIRLGVLLVTKLYSIGELKFINVSRKNQLAMILFKVNSYVPPILPVEIPGMAGDGFLVNDTFTNEEYKGCMILATWYIKIFLCRHIRFQF